MGRPKGGCTSCGGPQRHPVIAGYCGACGGAVCQKHLVEDLDNARYLCAKCDRADKRT